MSKQKILILGGSAEGFLLADIINKRFGEAVETITSFAGITKTRRKVVGKSRVGGFGGVAGMVDYLKQQQISLIIDATHPFAQQIKDNAEWAATQLDGVKLVHLLRPAWQASSEDDWTFFETMEQLASYISAVSERTLTGIAPSKALHSFLAIGRSEISVFGRCQNMGFIARVIDLPKPTEMPKNVQFIVARGPFDLEAERILFRQHAIDLLICKNSGGEAASAKLQVARERNIPVLMVSRPAAPKGHCTATIEGTVQWLEALL